VIDLGKAQDLVGIEYCSGCSDCVRTGPFEIVRNSLLGLPIAGNKRRISKKALVDMLKGVREEYEAFFRQIDRK